MPDKDADLLLWHGIRQGLGWAVALGVTSLAGAAALLALPAMFAAAVDGQISGDGDTSALLWLVAVLVALAGCELVGQLAAPASTAAGTRWLRHRLMRHVLALGIPAQNRFSAGDVVSRLVAAAPEAAGAGAAVVNALSSTVVSCGGAVALWFIDPWLALAFLTVVPLGILAMKVFVARTSPLATDYLATYGTIAERLGEALAGIRTIRACGTLRHEIERVLAPVRELGRLGHAMWLAYRQVSCRGSLLVPGIHLLVLAVAGHGLATDRITAGQFLAASGYTSLALGFLGQAGTMLMVARARGAGRRLAEILDMRPARGGVAELPSGPGELVLRQVIVRTGDRIVLDRVDLTVPPGRSVAVVGKSAAGKSTLAAVAGRLILPDQGQVLLDGVAIGSLRMAAVRQAVTYAFERPALLGTTVAEAIALGEERMPRERVVRAARLSCADHFIRRFPAGYDTPIEQAPMSGGEAQRLGIARAVARPSRVLILDDASSSLDTITERQISHVLTESLTARTRLVVTHRLTTVARCDLVAWLDHGRVRAVASHRVLWTNPEYRALFNVDDRDD